MGLYKINRAKGFSIIEVLIGSVLVVLIASGTYRFLESQNTSHLAAYGGAVKKNIAQKTLERFRFDVGQIDPNWQKLGLATIYPHPGLRYNENFYLSSSVSDEGLSDAVTIIRRHNTKTTIFQIEDSLQDPDPPSSDTEYQALYGTWITLPEDASNTSELEVDDWVMFYEPGKHVVGIIQQKIFVYKDATMTSGNVKIKVTYPNSLFVQTLSVNASGENSGFVTKAGIVTGSYDYNSSYTSDTEDDIIQLSSDKTYMQVVEPITYELDWMTSDGLPKSVDNTYTLNQKGEKQGAVVRTTYENNTLTREYLGKVDSLGFSYDILNAQTWMGNENIEGYTDGEIIRDVGREKDATIAGFFTLDVDPTTHESSFITTSNIVGVRMMVTQQWSQKDRQYSAFNETKIAIDPAFEDERFQQEHFLQAKDSGDIHTVSGLGPTEHIGKPLYFRNPNDDQDYVILPVLNLDENATDAGKLLFLNRDGCPVTAGCPTSGSAPSDYEFIVSFGDSSNQFYPTHVETVTDSGGNSVLLVGGMGMSGGVRTPMMATIEVGTGDMASILDSSSGGTLCSIPNCTLHTLNTGSASIRDTASGVFELNGEIWMSSLTKSSADDDDLVLYKTTLNTSGSLDPITQVTLNTGNTTKDRVVTAVGDKPFHFEGVDYIPVCLSRSIPCHRDVESTETGTEAETSAFLQNVFEAISPVQTCYATGSGSSDPCDAGPLEDGKIYLYPLDGSSSPKHIVDHNYLCTALQSVGDNLLIGSRLVTQVADQEEILNVLKGIEEPLILYTDEIASQSSDIYADAYLTYNSAFNAKPVPGQPPSPYGPFITWNSGTNVHKFHDGSLGVALGNRKIPDTGTDINEQSVITMDMDPGGMSDRVTSNIRTEYANLNASGVSSSFHEEQINLSGHVVLPGTMYYTSAKPRTSVMGLPYLEDSMDESDWLEFFMDIYDPKDRERDIDYNIDNPNPSSAADCSDSIPATCTIGG